MATPQPVLNSTDVENRYRHAYRVARTVAQTGQKVKGLARLFAILMLFLGLFAANLVGATAFLLGIAFALGIGGVGHVLGILIAAIGELYCATLDTAVNTSPFLGNEAKHTLLSNPQD